MQPWLELCQKCDFFINILILFRYSTTEPEHPICKTMHTACIKNMNKLQNGLPSNFELCAIKDWYSRTSMAGTLMAHSPGLSRTVIMLPIGHLCQIHPGWLELPLARTIFHGPKPVRAIEVLLYFCQNKNIKKIHPLFQEKKHIFDITGTLAAVIQPTSIFLSRFTA